MATRPHIATTLLALRKAVIGLRRGNRTLALVPTMGALHDGHLSLVRLARRRADRVAVSIFVNPTQFAPNEDYASYPRTLRTDLAALGHGGADLVWAPAAETMYPRDFSTRIVPAGPASVVSSLCPSLCERIHVTAMEPFCVVRKR